MQKKNPEPLPGQGPDRGEGRGGDPAERGIEHGVLSALQAGRRGSPVRRALPPAPAGAAAQRSGGRLRRRRDHPTSGAGGLHAGRPGAGSEPGEPGVHVRPGSGGAGPVEKFGQWALPEGEADDAGRVRPPRRPDGVYQRRPQRRGGDQGRHGPRGTPPGDHGRGPAGHLLRGRRGGGHAHRLHGLFPVGGGAHRGAHGTEFRHQPQLRPLGLFQILRTLRRGDGDRHAGGAEPEAGLPVGGRRQGLRPAAGGQGANLPLKIRNGAIAADR